MNNPSIETDLVEILKEIKSDQKELLDKITQIETKFSDKITHIEVSQAQMKSGIEYIKKEISEVKGSQNKQVWALIGIVFSAVGILGKIVFFPNP